MFAGTPVTLDCRSALEEQLETVHSGSAVFAIHAAEGQPYLGRTTVLRRRLKRLLKDRDTPSRLLNLRTLATHVHYWPVASRLQSDLVLYETARVHLPDRYIDFLKLRMPPYVRLTTASAWPRTQVTTKLTASGKYFGPFRSRAAAELFDHDLLELFQIRRCQEDFVPAPDHPGCIYGEMGMCLRPCQAAVSHSEYASEVSRVAEFLSSRGRIALLSVETARDRLSAEMQFEAAAQQHKRVEKIQALLRLRDDLVSDTDVMQGLAVLPSTTPGSVILWALSSGFWQAPVMLQVTGDHAESMDARVRHILESIPEQRLTPKERAEHLAILARWFYSSWRDGIWIDLEARTRAPYRKLVSAISRTVHQSAPAASH